MGWVRSGGQGFGAGEIAQIANPGSPNRPDPNYNTKKVSVFFPTKSQDITHIF